MQPTDPLGFCSWWWGFGLLTSIIFHYMVGVVGVARSAFKRASRGR